VVVELGLILERHLAAGDLKVQVEVDPQICQSLGADRSALTIDVASGATRGQSALPPAVSHLACRISL
jgi:hypothetical protein